MTTTTPAVELEGLGKQFGRVTALDDVSLTIEKGELVSLLGASGSGKSTLLRLIAGFDSPTSGRVVIDGADVSRLSPARRGIGMVFQNYALFPHLTVRRNIEYGLRMRGWARARRGERVDEMLERMRLTELGERLPRELSGGQQQRVAIARALAFSPQLLLMDEPLGALDKALKEDLLEEIRRVHREFGTTIVYVTHDREEALVLSDRIALVDAARLQVCAPVQDLFLRPPTAFAARFIAGATVLPLDGAPFSVVGSEAQRSTIAAGPRRFEVAGAVGQGGALAIRPAGLRVVPVEGAHLRVRVLEQVFLGDEARIRGVIEPSGAAITAMTPLADAAVAVEGAVIGLDVLPDGASVVEA